MPDEDRDICAKEIESWKSCGYALRKEDSEYFLKMSVERYRYSEAINAKEGLLPTELMIMALLITHYKMIKNLLGLTESNKINENTNILKICDDNQAKN